MNDKERLDWLEWMADKPGGLHLHAHSDGYQGVGLGTRNTGRSLRQAIDDAMRYDDEWHALGKLSGDSK